MTDKKVCSFEGCDRDVRSVGLCRSHYNQHQRGKPLAPLGRPRGRRADGHTNSANLLEDLEWIVGTDSAESVARRLGMSSPGALRGRLLHIVREFPALSARAHELSCDPRVTSERRDWLDDDAV